MNYRYMSVDTVLISSFVHLTRCWVCKQPICVQHK